VLLGGIPTQEHGHGRHELLFSSSPGLLSKISLSIICVAHAKLSMRNSSLKFSKENGNSYRLITGMSGIMN